MQDRYSRQDSIVNRDIFTDNPITIVGVGAIGREIGLKLVQMGVENITFIDFDKVEEPNICTQGYREEDIGKFKVEALKEECLRINSNANITIQSRRYSRAMNPGKILFCCVDDIGIRKLIFESAMNNLNLFIDTRMSAETLRVFSIQNNIKDIEYYPTTLFESSEAHQDTCTAKATCYCASIAAGLAVAQLSKWTRRLEEIIDKEISFNILTSEITAA